MLEILQKIVVFSEYINFTTYISNMCLNSIIDHGTLKWRVDWGHSFNTNGLYLRSKVLKFQTWNRKTTMYVTYCEAILWYTKGWYSLFLLFASVLSWNMIWNAHMNWFWKWIKSQPSKFNYSELFYQCVSSILGTKLL